MQDALGRLSRAAPARQAGWIGLALHLSRLAPPAPRAYHRRIARALLDDAAAKRAGQVFGLGNGDLVLLLRGQEAGAGLAATMARLFQIDVPDPAILLTLWRLPADCGAMRAYADSRLAERPAAPPPPEPAAALDAIEAADRLIPRQPATRLLQRQTAVLLTQAGAVRLRPLFREIAVSLAAMDALVPPLRHARTDPYLSRYLDSRLDACTLAGLSDDLRRGGPMTAGLAPALHVNLTLPAILSDAFAPFVAAGDAAAARIGVEVAVIEACAEPEAVSLARERLHGAGWPLVLDGVSHHTLVMTRLAALQPDLVKLDWSDLLPGAGQGVAAALAALGPGRVVLNRADSEAAMQWGLAHGIRRFQGRHVDAMLAAERIAACPRSQPCTLRQCVSRAASAEQRMDCGNLALLDAATPRSLPVSA